MSRIALTIVPDEGAAEMVRAALVEAGITPQFERAYGEHPYSPSVLAEPWRVFVPIDRLRDARNALARLAHEVADEADAQARAYMPVGALHLEPELRPHRGPRVSTALALAALLPFPAVCFYVRARRLGAIFLGLFLATLALAMVQAVRSYDAEDARAAARRARAGQLAPRTDDVRDAGLLTMVPNAITTARFAGDELLALGLLAKCGDLVFALLVLHGRRVRTGAGAAVASPSRG